MSGRGSGVSRSALVTGCSSGIGLAAAEGLRARGYRVFPTARTEADLERLATGGFEPIALDLADSASVQACAAEALRRSGGRIDVLVNNGAYGQPGAVEDLSREVLRAQFETNVFGWHELTNAIIPSMRASGFGRIVQVSSVLGLVALAYRGAYNASKFALEGLSDTLRVELHGTGIHVSIVEPGPITSRFRENARVAFERNVDAEASAHRDVYRTVRERLESSDEDPFTLPPEAVVRCIVHAVEHARPQPRYYVTKPTWMLATARRLLSHRGLDRLQRAIMRRETG